MPHAFHQRRDVRLQLARERAATHDLAARHVHDRGERVGCRRQRGDALGRHAVAGDPDLILRRGARVPNLGRASEQLLVAQPADFCAAESDDAQLLGGAASFSVSSAPSVFKSVFADRISRALGCMRAPLPGGPRDPIATRVRVIRVHPRDPRETGLLRWAPQAIPDSHRGSQFFRVFRVVRGQSLRVRRVRNGANSFYPMPDYTHFIFVDFENVQDVDLTLAKDKPVHVTLLIGAKQTKVPTKLATQLHSFAAQVAPVEVGGSGRNALDLTLAMYLGREIERHPQASFVIVSRDQDFDPMIAHLRSAGAHIERVSAFASVPPLAPARKSARPVKAARPPASKPSVRATPPARPTAPAAMKPAASLPPVTATEKSTDTPLPPRIGMEPIPDLARRQNAIFARLSNPTTKNRPATQKALVAQLRATLGKNVTEADVISTLASLKERRVLSIDAENRIVYAHR